MKSFLFGIVCIALTILFAGQVYSQDDEARQQSGLPTFIGTRPGSNPIPGTDANLSGSFVVQGLDDKSPEPTFTVVVLANGALVSRQRVKNKGSFSFNNVPRIAVSILVEVDGLEVTNYQIGVLNPPPLNNRQDVFITWMQIGQAKKQKAEVITIRNAYPRTEANQKVFDNAMEFLKNKKADAAQKELVKLVVVDPNDFVAWTELGTSHFTSEKYPDAETSYRKALALKTDFSPAMLNLGKLYLKQKKYEQAIDVLSKAITLTPDSPDINHFLGEAYLQDKKGSKAVPLLNRAIELAPIENAEIHLRLAALYNGANLKDRAVTEYKAFLQKVPDYSGKADIEKYIKDNTPK